MTAPIIYNYLDYRSFLKDLFSFKKNNNKNFSHRFLAARSGFSSPNFIKLVIDGKRNLKIESINKIAHGFGLNKQEHEFFKNLALMNQSDRQVKKDFYYKQMLSVRGYTNRHKIEKAKYEYFSKWYYPVIKEVITFSQENLSPEEIGKLLTPIISPSQVKKAIAVLQKLEMIELDEEGKWRQCNPIISTGPEVSSIIVTNFHKEMLKLATESIERHPSEERDITALTIGINKTSMPEIKKRIAALRKELLELACSEEESDQVIQINFQAFPLANLNKGES